MSRGKFRRGLTGIETAIILIAFVIVAAAFAFAILNVGFQTTQKSQSVISEGMLQASSSIDLVGAVIAEGNADNSKVARIRFTIKLSPGMTPVDLSPDKLIISWWSKNKYITDIYTTNSSMNVTIIALTPNDNDFILKPGEKYEVIINVTGIGDTLQPYDEFKIEIKPEKGSVLTIERMIPPKIEPVMFLGLLRVLDELELWW